MCWVVARPPKSGGVVKTTRSSQNGAERTTDAHGRAVAVEAGGRARTGGAEAAPAAPPRPEGTSAATRTTYPPSAARQPKCVIAHWQGGARP